MYRSIFIGVVLVIISVFYAIYKRSFDSLLSASGAFSIFLLILVILSLCVSAVIHSIKSNSQDEHPDIAWAMHLFMAAFPCMLTGIGLYVLMCFYKLFYM
ncbi:hypothetical protein GMB86_07765 [Terrilactibacillus sp. BCM23-1]|uniref:Uncharacterized protein n=1 Tax=Terrilactibacillus tamarindi TaxID=2599694 RepID=A0A6N8CP11_9BACI|nr:hypothetical protein [Terrilactibacillus tamarindi]MTT31904.1 hypothetical protein [Terrilactibacillus tamarindi]